MLIYKCSVTYVVTYMQSVMCSLIIPVIMTVLWLTESIWYHYCQVRIVNSAKHGKFIIATTILSTKCIVTKLCMPTQYPKLLCLHTHTHTCTHTHTHTHTHPYTHTHTYTHNTCTYVYYVFTESISSLCCTIFCQSYIHTC